ncbi:hypothetical protein JW960_21010 [candidate division KSB1 bacterium]|nr:hypothetical protein [candidate division KSB1 bacterium]
MKIRIHSILNGIVGPPRRIMPKADAPPEHSANGSIRTLSLPSRSGVPPQFAARTVSKGTISTFLE